MRNDLKMARYYYCLILTLAMVYTQIIAPPTFNKELLKEAFWNEE